MGISEAQRPEFEVMDNKNIPRAFHLLFRMKNMDLRKQAVHSYANKR